MLQNSKLLSIMSMLKKFQILDFQIKDFQPVLSSFSEEESWVQRGWVASLARGTVTQGSQDLLVCPLSHLTFSEESTAGFSQRSLGQSAASAFTNLWTSSEASYSLQSKLYDRIPSPSALGVSLTVAKTTLLFHEHSLSTAALSATGWFTLVLNHLTTCS